VSEKVHVRPGDEARGCEVHDWPNEGFPKRLVAEMRAKHGRGGVNACRACVERAGDVAKADLLKRMRGE
jgi:hypothetical protein